MRIFDIACGLGFASAGTLQGLNQIGIKGAVLGGVDPDPLAAQTFTLNLNAPVDPRPIETIPVRDLPRVDVVLAGPPCQGDSTMARSRASTGEIPDRRLELGNVKHAALDRGRAIAPLMVLEIVGRAWDGWCVEQGGAVVRLDDAQLGGYTMRRRTLAFFGLPARYRLPSLQAVRERFQLSASPGWGAALPHLAGKNRVLASEGDRHAKHPYQHRASHEPAFACLGHGARHRIYATDPWAYLHRCTPQEQAALQGFPSYRLPPADLRSLNRLVGNGWPASYGRYVAAVLADLA